ncbi:MAG: hypothetical protein IT423_07280 [Pirellulaceae bacterium]|nr:hypothetical protein [Pirellulaceae bacterium]
MSYTDVDQLIVAMHRDAGIVGCARADQLASWEQELVRIQDEVARALQKIRERQAA